MLKVGILGVGGISGVHIPAWEAIEGTELVAICDIRQECVDKYDKYNKYMDFEDMLANEELDILDICLPSYLHTEYSVKAMNRGIHVVCEKPVSLNREDVKLVYETARKNDVKYMVAQVLRFWDEYVFLNECFKTQKYGKLLSGMMQRLNVMPGWSWDDWMRDKNRSGYVPFDLHIHDLDFMVWTFGEPMDCMLKRSQTESQDYLSAIYDYGDFFVTIESSWYASKKFPFEMGYRFQFEDAVIVFKDNKLTVYEANGNVIDTSKSADDTSDTLNLPKTDAYANELSYFTDCVINNKPTDKVKPEELEKVLEILKIFG